MCGYNNELSSNYSKERSKFIYTDKDLFQELEHAGIKDKIILDFGCGDGIHCFELSKRGAKKIIGIDSSSQMIQLAQAKLEKSDFKNIEFLEADGTRLPFKDGTFDLVLANYVLVHFKDLQKPLSEIFRVLKPGGSLVATIDNADFLDENLENIPIPLKLGGLDNVIVNDYLRTDEKVQNSLNSVGFKINSYEKMENPNVIVEPNYPLISKISNFHCVIFSVNKS